MASWMKIRCSVGAKEVANCVNRPCINQAEDRKSERAE